jgi:hypothetical protein
MKCMTSASQRLLRGSTYSRQSPRPLENELPAVKHTQTTIKTLLQCHSPYLAPLYALVELLVSSRRLLEVVVATRIRYPGAVAGESG